MYPKGRTSIVNDTCGWLGSPLKGVHTRARLGKGARGPIFYLTSSPDSNERKANSIFGAFCSEAGSGPNGLRIIAGSVNQSATFICTSKIGHRHALFQAIKQGQIVKSTTPTGTNGT